MSSASDVLQAGANVVSDPCLPEVARLLNQLHELETTSPLPGETPPTTATLGIGLCKAVAPLQGVIYLRQNPIIGVAAIAGFLGIFVGIGYKMGKRASRKAAP